jgi:predicted ATPase/DNA-binding SARP family transcriptional activator
MQLNLYLFGPPRIERNGQPVELNLRKALALLAYVGVTRQSHSRDLLATLCWPDKNQQTARANLRRTLHELGQLLEAPLFEAATDRVALRADAPLWLDIEHFRRCLAAALPAESAPRPLSTGALMPLLEAVDLYTADFMVGFTLPDCPEFDEWQFFEREELRRSFAALLGHLILTYESEGKWEDALRYARRWLTLDPLEEAAHRRLMQLYAQAGQTSAGLRQYEECVRILQQELDAPPTTETTALYDAIRTRRFPQNQGVGSREWGVENATPHSPPPTPHLPYSPTPFIGRRQEVAELLQRLADPDCRLLTVVGPGGIGKTRLALEVAHLIAEPAPPTAENPKSKTQNSKFTDGVYFVPLQPVGAPNGIVPAIADALGFQFYSGAPPQEQLLSFLREKQTLLVLDNFEHLLPGAPLVVDLLAGAPGIKLLVTSREALKLAEEWFHPLAGMRLPPVANQHAPGADHPPSQLAEQIATYDAVQLFIQTARRIVVDFQPEPLHEQIVRICRLVDGMPLGIVLAASWLKVLTCAQIAQEIERGVDILVTRHQNVPERHRNMRVVLEQSWQLLDGEAQRVLKQLAVFRGGFLTEAASVVAGANLLTLADLVDTAWVYRTPDGRYQMHELLRQFAAEQLADDPSLEEATYDHHATYYLQQVAHLAAALLGPEQRAALDQIGGEFDNITAAWGRAAERARFDLIAEALEGFNLFFVLRSRYPEGKEAIFQALNQLERSTAATETAEAVPLSHRLQARLGAFCVYQGDLVAADHYFDAVLSQSADLRELAFVYRHLGLAARWRGNRSYAEKSLQQSLDFARQSGDHNQMVETLLGLADTASSFGNFSTGEQYNREALALCQQLQRPDLTANVLASLAWATNCLGRYAESEQYYRESLALSEAIGNPSGIGLATQFLGWVAFCEGGERLADALSLYEQATAIYRRIGYSNLLAMVLGDYALAAVELGKYDAALRSAQEGLALMEALGHQNLVCYNLNGLGAATYGLNDLEASRRYLIRSLQSAHDAQIPDHAGVALLWLARLLVKEGHTGHSEVERTQKELRALALLAWVIHQPTTWQPIRDRAQQTQTELVERLPPVEADAAYAQGTRWTLAQIVTEFMVELAPARG